MNKSIKTVTIIAIFGFLFGMIYHGFDKFQASIVNDGSNTGQKIYFEDFSDLGTIDAEAGATGSLDETEIRFGNLIQKKEDSISPAISTEILGPVSVEDQFDSFSAYITNESPGIRYITFRFLDPSFSQISVGGSTEFNSSDLPVDLTPISEGTIYLEINFHNTGASSDSAELNSFSIEYSNIPESFIISKDNSFDSGAGTIEYNIMVNSNGGNIWDNFVVTDVLDPDVQYVSTTDSGISVSGHTVTINYSNAELAGPAVTKSFTVEILPEGLTRNKICNLAIGSTDGISMFIATPTCTTITGGSSGVDGVFSITLESTLLDSSKNIVYNLTVANTDGTNWDNFVVIDILDDDLEYVGTADSGISVNDQTVILTYNVAEFSGGPVTKSFTTHIADSGLNRSVICNFTFGSADGIALEFSEQVCDDISNLVICGNGSVDFGEQCDDGNTVSEDGCSSSCETEVSVCGNSILEFDEDCDDGNTSSGDGCSSICETEISVPDSAVEAEATIEESRAKQQSLGKAASRYPGMSLEKSSKSIQEANQPIPPQIIRDEQGNIISIIPGKLDPLLLAERLMNKPKPWISRGGIFPYSSAPKMIEENALTVSKPPSRSISKDYSPAEALQQRRLMEQLKLEEQQEKEKTEEELIEEIIEEIKEEIETQILETYEEVSPQAIEEAPVLSQTEEAVSVEEGGVFTLETEEGVVDSPQIAVEVPTGFLSEQTDVSISMKTLDMGDKPTAAPVADGKKLTAGPIIDLSVVTTEQTGKATFDKPVTLSIPYVTEDVEDINPETLRVHTFNEEQNIWEELPNDKVNTEKQIVTAETDHFSFFSILGDLTADVVESEYVQYQSTLAPGTSNYEDMVKKTKKHMSEKDFSKAYKRYTKKEEAIEALSYNEMIDKYKLKGAPQKRVARTKVLEARRKRTLQPSVITHLMAESGEGKVSLSWTLAENGKDIKKYIIKFGVERSDLYQSVRTSGNQPQWIVEGLLGGQTYYFQVIAVYSNESKSAPSKIINADAFGER